MSSLDIDGGAPPPPPEDRPPVDETARPAEPVIQLAGDLPEWEVRTVGFMLGVLFMVLHLTVGRGGPEDAFLPSDRERREMAEPVAATLNRFVWARRLAPLGDGFAALAITGEFLISETKRVALHRAGGGQPAERPDADLAGIATVARALDDDTGRAEPQLRPWRPPIPAEP